MKRDNLVSSGVRNIDVVLLAGKTQTKGMIKGCILNSKVFTSMKII